MSDVELQSYNEPVESYCYNDPYGGKSRADTFRPYGKTRPFTGEADVLLEEVSVGDIVKFCHDNNGDHKESMAVILGIGDSTLKIATIMPGNDYYHGKPSNETFGDRGLAPYSGGGWNNTNHTEMTGINTSTYLLDDPDMAQRILNNMIGFDGAVDKFGLTHEPSLEHFAQQAVLIAATRIQAES